MINLNLQIGDPEVVRDNFYKVQKALETPGSIVYPGAGIPVSTGSAWGTSIPNGTDGKVLTMVAGVAAWAAAPSTSPGGYDKEVQFNNGGVFSGSPKFSWNYASDILSVMASINTQNIMSIRGAVSLNGYFIIDSSSGQAAFKAQSGTTTLKFQAGNSVTYGSQFTCNNAYNGSSANVVRIANNVGLVSNGGVSTINQLLIDPTYNIIGTAAHIMRGIYYSPTLTELKNSKNIAFQNTSGDVLLGTTSGSTSIGATTTINASAIMQIESTTKGFLPPRMTTTNWNSISAKAEGLEGWDTVDHAKLWFDGTRTIGFRFNGTKFQGYDGTAWVDLN